MSNFLPKELHLTTAYVSKNHLKQGFLWKQRSRHYFLRTQTATTGLARFIESNADIFFAGICDTDSDMLKALLSESIKNVQTLLNIIQEHEDKV